VLVNRDQVVESLREHFDSGGFVEELSRRVAYRTESQIAGSLPILQRYLEEEMATELSAMGYEIQLIDNPVAGGGPFLVGRRIEDPGFTTVLTYGHGDVVPGHEGRWDDDRDPWTVDIDGERIYGRGVADNKGQHTVNLRALRAVIETRGKLGFNSVVMIETGEELGSPGIHEFCDQYRELLHADVLIASDGPRQSRDRPTLFMGSRGALNFDLEVDFRDGGHHSGNWGGLLANPAIVLANAIASIADERGRIKVRALVPEHMPNSVRNALAEVTIEHHAGEPEIDPDWGEPNLTPAERVYGWNTFEVLAFTAGNPEKPVNAIPPSAKAHCQIRYTVDRDPETFLPALREHFAQHGFGAVEVRSAAGRTAWKATRLDPEHPWVEWIAGSIRQTLGVAPVRLPNLGGTLPNDAFASVLGIPTVYVPHSYPACSQHAPNEHGLDTIFREGLMMMGGIFWDLGEHTDPSSARGSGTSGQISD
jgi:acetylornithine deacetylase/succinyl-diaminopimelate desuccinylase-like protein